VNNTPVHIELVVPEWIAEFLIAKVDEESVRLHAEAVKDGEKDEIQEDGRVVHSKTRRLANQLGAAKNELINRLRCSRGLLPMTHGTQIDQRSAECASAATATTGGAHASIHDRAGLYVAIVALAVALYGFGQQSQSSQVIESKVQAGMAQASRDMQQQAAEAKATAQSARTDARVALDKVEDFRAKLAEKGINVNLDGH
jgi:hypothetical protein